MIDDIAPEDIRKGHRLRVKPRHRHDEVVIEVTGTAQHSSGWWVTGQVVDGDEATHRIEHVYVPNGSSVKRVGFSAPDWVVHLTDKRLASDLQKIAENVRWCSAEERTMRLLEAARRLERPRDADDS
jgi:hypothetical protein